MSSAHSEKTVQVVALWQGQQLGARWARGLGCGFSGHSSGLSEEAIGRT